MFSLAILERSRISQPADKRAAPMAPRKIENWMTSKAPTLPPNGRSMRVEFSAPCANAAGAAATSAAKETVALRMTRLRGLKPSESKPFRCLPALNADLLRKLPVEPTSGIFPLSPPPGSLLKKGAPVFQNSSFGPSRIATMLKARHVSRMNRSPVFRLNWQKTPNANTRQNTLIRLHNTLTVNPREACCMQK
ncbi:hypothetical protein FQZ97_978130 [compost metagenome]